jgi:small multidrug resistance pump
MGWIFLVAAIVMEVAGTLAAKHADGFTNHIASILMLVCYGLSLGGVSFAMRSIEMSTAYPIWTGTAILVISVLDITLFHESMSYAKATAIFFLVIGLIGLTMGNQSHS